MSELQLQLKFHTLFQDKYILVGHNTFPTWSHPEMDLFGLRKSGYLDEIEIKLSVSDFKNDFKKIIHIKEGGRYKKHLKHTALPNGLVFCNRFSFLLPHTIVNDCEIPKYAGLYVRDAYGHIREVKKAPLLHKRKIEEWLKFSLAQKMQFRYWKLKKEIK
jgi:hypothetical protein